MNALKAGLIAAVLAAAFASVSSEVRTNRALHDELVRARRKSMEVDRLRKGNRTLAASLAQLAASPPPAAVSVPILRRVPPLKAPPKVALSPGFSSTAECRNVGTATARDAFETYVWSLIHGEVATLAGVLGLSDDSRTRIDALYANLPATVQEKYGSAEQMFATVFAYDNPVLFAGMQVAPDSPSTPDTEILSTQWQYPRGQIRNHEISLRLTPAGWKLPVADDEVTEALGQILGPGR